MYLTKKTLVIAFALGGRINAQSLSLGPSTFTVPGAFPTSVYSSYYNNPTQTSEQVQPVISDPVTHTVYPFDLTNPDTIPVNDTNDPHPLPPRASDSTILAHAVRQIQLLATPETPNSPFLNDTCAKCQAALGILKFVALAAPEQGPAAVVAMCQAFKLSSNCNTAFGPLALGSVITQVVARADVEGFDGQMMCQNFLSACPLPPTSALNLTNWFAKPKPNPLPPPKKPSGKRLKVLSLSDIHLDARYATGAEANCTSGLCCREGNVATSSPNQTLVPAPRFGAFLCDSPYSLTLSALEAIPVLTGTQDTGFAWTLYNGDLVAHDTDAQLSQAYVEYVETVIFDLIKRMLKAGPTYVVIGNHDSVGVAEDAPKLLGGELAHQYDWNYEHVSSLWQHEDWIPEAAVELARAHYGGYMVRRKDGLRIITLNTNLWYRANWFNYINMTSSDPSGILRFLTDELQDAEDAGDRVWIMGHVLSGWDGTNALLNPSNLFYQIVDRYSPHVIAGIFWGHTHEDELSIFYTNNGTVQSAENALVVSWNAPSITPASNLNSGFRVYEVDSSTFEVLDAHTWKSDVNAFPALDGQTAFGPTFTYEYSARDTYGGNITGWGSNDPLNATWWHRVTEVMENDTSLVQTFNTLQGKSSVRTKPCTGECITAKICYLRSGSSSIAKQNCPAGFGSVQGLF
ncbi:uncharacterized protein FOMMEDRAFT_18613 [Fomitiporia mediterranea MF3/22]|uniref:uncharacterized protein n=1 Tax=Fomitiporia mediterranea (strain MF3/22) TaxID=694068 RepID=UPI0004408115|nr:uncharacterized protein FOMMEDRAFT_18613 [Fomitiporia mediterranea MF3/22]EJD04893.1 hypothetical protein FOMMEDRAFT_18613 [Fomitiporia mediterranea MF3/22]